jgi:predicted phage terminase large subunit-like protein
MERQIDFEDRKVLFAVNKWTDLLIEQLLAFPNGEHDDRIDAMLLSMQKPTKKLFISSI